MSPLSHLLESFYTRLEPQGVAFVGSAKLGVSFGRPVTSRLESSEGFTQHHSENEGLSVYTSSFGWGKLLVAQFDFQEDFPPPTRPWMAFVRLAALIQRYLDNPTDFPEPPGAAVPVLRPSPVGPKPRSLSAEASFEKPEH